jgi:hypothetical protein
MSDQQTTGAVNEIRIVESSYVISTEEILWGDVLWTITIALHGLGMVLTLHVSKALKRQFERLDSRSFLFGVVILVVAAWMIVLVNLAEISVWAGFYVWRGAIQNPSIAFYYALVNYATLDSGYLPRRWRLLEGVLAMAGLLTFAWSTGVLFTLAQQFQDRALRTGKPRHEKADREAASDVHHHAGDKGE